MLYGIPGSLIGTSSADPKCNDSISLAAVSTASAMHVDHSVDATKKGYSFSLADIFRSSDKFCQSSITVGNISVSVYSS